MTQSMTKSPLPPASPEIPADLPPHRLSLVVPMYNEAENVEPLLERVHVALDGYPFPWEILLVDDGSSDSTPAEPGAARQRTDRMCGSSSWCETSSRPRQCRRASMLHAVT